MSGSQRISAPQFLHGKWTCALCVGVALCSSVALASDGAEPPRGEAPAARADADDPVPVELGVAALDAGGSAAGGDAGAPVDGGAIGDEVGGDDAELDVTLDGRLGGEPPPRSGGTEPGAARESWRAGSCMRSRGARRVLSTRGAVPTTLASTSSTSFAALNDAVG
jgi:hypothetical protein